MTLFFFVTPTTKLPRRKNSKISRAIQAAVHEERRQRQRLEQQQQQRAAQESQPENREQRLQDAVDEAHRHLAVILAARNEHLELQIHADPNELPGAHEDPQADK